MRLVSAKRRQQLTIRRRLLEQRRDEPCAVKWEGCTYRMDTLHEPLLRSRGGDPASESGTVPVCNSCHRKVHSEPQRATEDGWMVHSRRVFGGEP